MCYFAENERFLIRGALGLSDILTNIKCPNPLQIGRDMLQMSNGAGEFCSSFVIDFVENDRRFKKGKYELFCDILANIKIFPKRKHIQSPIHTYGVRTGNFAKV